MNSAVCGRKKKDSVIVMDDFVQWMSKLCTVDVEMSASDIGSTANRQGRTWMYFS